MPLPTLGVRGSGSRATGLIRLVVLVLVAASLSFLGLSPSTAAPDPAPQDKIRTKLAHQLDAKGEATFWVRFRQADLTSMAQSKSWEQRGQAVYDTLTSTADQRQKDVKALLEDRGASYQSFWATNAIRVDAGTQKLADEIAAMPEVTGLYPVFEYRLEEPKKGEAIHTKQAVEWGVANINADDVWSQYGVTGDGIVVGSIDSGVQFDHPALVNQYRGNNGDGTFDHNYNWFDAAGSCPDAPCDLDGHGTHTMGTMSGDDGAGNQIGVAPGVKWISANGCCPSDAALIASGQWMLAPTDLNGENPDTSKRPDIINNSWGTRVPSNDPFMEDVEAAWAAAGIFGTWSNGNNGPSCETSGSPGSRILNYSVGAYDVNNQIAGFSSRGAGQEGEIKPNISAPGVNVRSSVPGNGYASYSGTSMAAPHLAGAIALLWSAAPALVGDIDTTRALLDGSATDVDATTCGGTADDNNVFGEGRLDALALLDSAPIGDTGTVAGTVTDSGSGEAIAGASVDIAGEFSRSVTTDEDGSYSVLLPVGDYTATVAKFGYETTSAEVTVTTDQTTTQDFALVAAPSVTVSGSVADGSGHGWPLYASVDITGPADDVWTDPATGEYSVTVPSNATYTMTVDAAYPGYEPVTQDITVGDGDASQDVTLTVDPDTCTAPGYRFNSDGVIEDFNAGTLPDGWTIEDNVGNGQVWRFDDPETRGNLTGGDGAFAIMDSDYYGSGNNQDTSLVSPVIDMSSLTAPVVGFKQDYNNLGDVADVDVSVDGGATWETVLNQTSDVRGPREDVLPLPMAAGEPDVQVRFHSYEMDYDWWWEVDDVFIGNRTCDPVEGGLVLGNVYDANTSEAINGATVTSLDAPETTTTTAPTPDDEALDDGFYWMFSNLLNSHPFEATANQYETVTEDVDVDADDATRADFTLGAGHVTVTPTELSATRRLGSGPVTREFTVANDGTNAVELEFSERKGDFEMLGADGSRSKAAHIARQDGAPLQEIKGPVSFAATANGKTANASTEAPKAPYDDPWTSIADYPANIMDNRVVHLDGMAYSIAGGDGSSSTADVWAYDPATLGWVAKAPLPEARNAVAAGVVDGEIVVTGGWGPSGPSTATWTYDPAGDSWSAAAAAPTGLAASGQAVADGKLYVVGGCTTASCTPMSSAVAAYDPATDSWSELADYPSPTAFASCGGIDGMVYCTGGNDGGGGTADSFVYDPGADAWTPIEAAPIDSWASGFAVANGQLVVNGGVQGGVIANRTFAYDPEAGAWTDLPNSNTARYRGGVACGLYKVGGSSGSFNAQVDSEMLPGFEDCGSSAADVEWLSVSPATATLAPGDSVTVEVTMDPNVAQPGTYTAAVGVKEDAPGSVDPVAVTFEVTPPKAWGKLAGTVDGASCAGDTAPIAGATLQVDSWAGSRTFETESDGTYAYWFNSKANPLQLIAAKDGYQPQTRQVRLKRGRTVIADFTLKEAGC